MTNKYEKLIKDNKKYLAHLHKLLEQDRTEEIELSSKEKISIIKESRSIQKDLIQLENY